MVVSLHHYVLDKNIRKLEDEWVVVGTEVGGRFSTEVVQFLRLLAQHRAAAVPRLLRPAAISAWVARWSGLHAVAAQRVFAASLLGVASRRRPW